MNADTVLYVNLHERERGEKIDILKRRTYITHKHQILRMKGSL